MYSSDDRGSKCPHCGAWTTYNDYFDLAQVIQDKKIIGLVSVVTLTELVTTSDITTLCPWHKEDIQMSTIKIGMYEVNEQLIIR